VSAIGQQQKSGIVGQKADVPAPRFGRDVVIFIGCPPGACRADSRTISEGLKAGHAALPKGHK